MSKDTILEKLRRYGARYPEEADTVERFIRFVEQNPDCFQRSLAAGHVTGSAWVVDKTGRKVLLTHHRKLNKWLQLGGHADGDSDVLSAAMREVEEESGLRQVRPLSSEIFDVDIHLIPERGTEEAHYHYDLRFLFVSTGDEAYTVSEESHDLSWIGVDRLHELTQEESMLRMARKWKAEQAAGGAAAG